MATNSDPEEWLKLNKCDLAISLHAECSQKGNAKSLHDMLNTLLNPFKSLNDYETIDWCKWIIGGGRSPDKFANLVRSYDNANTCGFVWTPKYIAYRCRTCGIEACMSLCGDCYKNGNHNGHDVIQFPSQSGGQCDCGNTDVMREMGFCHNHGPNKKNNNFPPPSDLLCIAKHMMPRIIFRLIQALREISTKECNTTISNYVKEQTEAYVKMLMDFSDMGNHMRQVISEALRSTEVYKLLNKVPSDSNYTEYVIKNLEYYDNAVKELGLPEGMENFQNTPVFQKYVTHNTFLEELTFWMVKFEFPQNVVCLLLNLLQESNYKEAFADTFVYHYIRLPLMLEKVAEIDDVGNRIVQTTVQLFTNESLVTRMNERHNLLLIMIVSLKYLICRSIPSGEVKHQVANCSSYILKNHYYWPIVSDFNNILQNHKSVALHFMEDDLLLHNWFSFISMFQGMNPNQRDTLEDIEVQSNWSAFAGEFEGVSEPTRTLVNHLMDSTTTYHSRHLLSVCLTSIREWFRTINFSNSDLIDQNQISFHIPLHRIFAVLLSQAVMKQGLLLNEILPQDSEMIKLLIMHPLIINVSLHEIINKYKRRNDPQLPTQAITYTQCIFSNSMIDADFYLMQICCTRISRNSFLSLLVSSFKVQDWTVLSNSEELNGLSLESFLSYLTTLTCLRINLGMSKEEVNKLELSTILSKDDSTRSHLLREIPNIPEDEVDRLLKELALYKPRYNMQDGIYLPKEIVWEKYYDPMYVTLRHVKIGNSTDRFLQYHADKHGYKLLDKSNYWLPYRHPVDCNLNYSDPRIILQSRIFHGLAFALLYKAVHCEKQTYDLSPALALMVFLLDTSTAGITFCNTERNISKAEKRSVCDMDITTWYESDCLKENLVTEIGSVVSSKDDKNVTTKINESILSLLLKLHSKLSGAEDSYNPDMHQGEASSSTCQEEPYAVTGSTAIAKFLDKISNLSNSCRNYIKEIRSKLWPPKLVSERLKIKRKKKELEEENKKKMSIRERQKQLLLQIASQGKQFMDSLKTEAMDQTSDEITENRSGILCHICNANSNGAKMGVPVFIQGTKVAGSQSLYEHRVPLPTSNEEWALFKRDDTLSNKFEERAKLIEQHFQLNPLELPVQVGRCGGLNFHTCGHPLHISCLLEYRNSLPEIVEESDASRFYMPTYNEYLCPTCRQLSNDVLPIEASIKREVALISGHQLISTFYKGCAEVRHLLDKIGRIHATQKYPPDGVYDAMESIVTNTRSNFFKNDFKPELLHVACSHVRTILEVELLQRGGNLLSIEKAKSIKISRQSCLVPLINVTNFYARSVFITLVVTIFRQLTYISKVPEKTLEGYVPLMLQDPIAVLIWLIQVLGLELEQVHFTMLVKINYNLLYYQVLMQIFTVMSNSERTYFYKDTATKPNTLRGAMKLISKSFGHDIKKMDDDVNLTKGNSRANLSAIEEEVQTLCLPYLRIASILKHHLYNQPLPEITKPENEFVTLVNFLELFVDKSQSFNAAAVLSLPSKNNFDTILPQTWCAQLSTLINRNAFVAKSLIRGQHVSWKRPRLLQLPREYEKFFAYYYSKPCSRCNTIPEEASVCLVCGTLICKYQKCCRNKDFAEDIHHANECGGGTGIFLDAASTFVYIIYGIRAYSWGSPYLDSHEEEDRDLRRGKPLFLCSNRYQMLEDQWLSHRLDELKNNKWVLHHKDPLSEYE